MFKAIKRLFTPSKWTRITKRMEATIQYRFMFNSGKERGFAWVEENQFGVMRGRVSAIGMIKTVELDSILKQAIESGDMDVHITPYANYLQRKGYRVNIPSH